MKTCPICNAIAFDDATTCFGCLHRFESRGIDDETAFASNPPSFAGGAEPIRAIAYDADAGRAPGIGSAASRDSYDAISCADTAPIPLGAIEGSLGHEPEAAADTTPETISTTPVEPELCASYEVHDPFTMALPSFFIKLTPSHEETGAVTWSCGVELASA